MGIMGLNSKKRQEKYYILNKNTSFQIQEAYRETRTNLMFSLPDEKCKKIMFTSALRSEAKSTTSINMGISFALKGVKVLLIDCDLRLSSVASKLAIKRKPGLSDYLVGQAPLKDCIRVVTNGLHVIPAGELSKNSSELLSSAKMKKLLEDMSENYDYILIDSTPICDVTDAIILSRDVSGVVMVVRQGVADRRAVEEAISKLEMADAKILGFVMTDAKVSKKSKYGYYGYYGYGEEENK